MTSAEIVNLPSSRHVAAAASQATAVEQARAVAEVAAAVQVAQQNPRDETRAIERMRQSCRQPALAERAFYSLPRAGGRIEGETVHLARELIRCWTNADHGIRELRRDDDAGVSEMQAWAWDQELNVRASRSFIVPHARMAKDKTTGAKKREALVDLADIANNNNSVAARAVRETIFQVIPPWFKVEAAGICAKTLQDGGGKTLAQQVADAIAHFHSAWNVTVEQLETRIDRAHERWTSQDIGLLRVISGELERGEKRVEEEFPDHVPSTQRVTAAEIAAQQPPARSDVDEQPPAEAVAQPRAARMISRAQSTKLHAVLGELHASDRAYKLRVITALVGRPVESSNDLTQDEAKVAIDTLESIAQRDNPPENLAFIVEAAESNGGDEA